MKMELLVTLVENGNPQYVRWQQIRRELNALERCEASMDWASALASVVLPVPGKSSSNTCPPLASAARSLRVAPVCPCMTCAMFAAIF